MKKSHTQSDKTKTGLGHVSRRQFVRASALGAAAISFPFVGNVLGANDRINVASVGVGGKGSSDVDNVVECGGNIVAICDVDARHLTEKAKKLVEVDKIPQPKFYNDFRKMLEEMEHKIDAVTVSVPDHCHGLASAIAIGMGKHVYCQKPLTQTIFEARQLRDLAAKKKVATQMGNQGSANSGLRRGVEIIQAGVIGQVSELHVWSNRPIWPQGFDRPPGEDPVPDYLNWDAWIGPAKMRPYKDKIYHDFVWRGWYDFGTGALGDMACHMVNMPFRALKMGYPTVVQCEQASTLHAETFPKTSRIRFEFPEREGLKPLKFWWYDGDPKEKDPAPLRPPPEVTKDLIEVYEKLPDSGFLLIGDKGNLFSPNDYGGESLLMLSGEKSYSSTDKHEAARAVPKTIPRLQGNDEDLANKQEWFDMIRNGTPSYSNFAIATKLTEIILLGCVALRVGVGKEMQWDGKHAKSPNCPEAAQFLKRENRKGWNA